jgi:hypothetical protein
VLLEEPPQAARPRAAAETAVEPAAEEAVLLEEPPQAARPRAAAETAVEPAAEEAVLLEEPPQAARPRAAAETPAAFRKLRRVIIFFIISSPSY